MIGRGHTPFVDAAGGNPGTEKIWSVTVESDIGWYVIVSGACDIVRDPAVEPCIAVTPQTIAADAQRGGFQRSRSPKCGRSVVRGYLTGAGHRAS